MNLKEYKAGTYIEQLKYKSFSPTLINHNWYWDEPKINVLLEEAARLLSELDAYSMIVPDIDLFISMHIAKEATLSSRIEGTKTRIEEVMLDKEDLSPEKRDDWKEVQNYIKAINYSIKKLEKLPLSNRLLRETHEILLKGTRGDYKTPGEFRKSQNWIGGSRLSDAAYIPPHVSELSSLMSDLENFFHNESLDVPHLIKIAIAHYQFETIHPFLDGNGRIGRLMITLYLVSVGLLAKPSLYLSAFFEKHRSSYYDALSRVRESNDLIHWIKFFLNAVIDTAGKGKETFSKILALKDKMNNLIVTLNRRAENGRILIKHLYRHPIVTASEVSSVLGITISPANSLIEEFINLGILEEATGKSRNRSYIFRQYLSLYSD